MTTSLQTLVDKQDITELIYRYCRSVDRLDEALGYSIWHDDGIADYGDFYRGPGRGVIDLICDNHRHTLHHSHQLANILINVDGEQAGSEAYVTANLRVKQGETTQQITVWTRYIDRWEKRDGRWGLVKRKALRDFDEVREVTPMSQPQSEGSRDRLDPSYSALNLFES
ncbi:nuclear transport factor 2 family protein [Litorivivens sp.]|uniref:nuclear transport factor 2 family protein n=1 Tax=Litorivivens sp. TaxID=2020868 RepID=UPI0035647A52